MSKQTAIEMYSHLYGKEVAMNDRFETKVIWSEEIAIINNGKWIPQEVCKPNKQTAVDIAFEKLANQGILVTKDYKNLVAYREAKQMEREQIIDAYTECWSNDGGNYLHKIKEAEQFYNETYGESKTK